MRKKPNVILCICDQLRAFETGVYGNGIIQTPHIDRLAEEGVRFEIAVTNNPVCMPARSCLLSGQYSRSCMGMLGNYAERRPDGTRYMSEYPVDDRVHMPEQTLPEVFKTLGYDTALIGKWHIQPSPGIVGFDYSLFPRVHHRHSGQIFVENTGEGEVVDGFSVEFESDRVRQYLRGRRTQNDPFFLYYSISPPHMPLMDAPDHYLNRYHPQDIPLRPNVFKDGKLPFDDHWFKVYLWDFLHYDHHLPYTEKLPDGFDLRRLIALYYGMTTWVDDMIGRLRNELEESNLADDTIIVFLSDHGDNLGSHHLFNKGQLIEESIRIPFVFHAPQAWSAGVNTTHVAQIIDVMPTLITLCGGDIPDHVQGRSLSNLIFDHAILKDPEAFIETSDGKIGIRTPTALYGIKTDPSTRTVIDDRFCFYDLIKDPYEQTNLLESSFDTKLTNNLRDQLLSWHESTPWLNNGDNP